MELGYFQINALNDIIKSKVDLQSKEDIAYQNEQKKKGEYVGIPPKTEVDHDILHLVIERPIERTEGEEIVMKKWLPLPPAIGGDLSEDEFNRLYGITSEESIQIFAKAHDLEIFRG